MADRAEESLTAASPDRRPRLVLAAYFYAYIPMLLGIAATAAGIVLLTAVVAGTLAVERRAEHATVKA